MEVYKEWLETCISSGKCYPLKGLTQEQEVEIDDILYRYNDKTAKTKIKNVINRDS